MTRSIRAAAVIALAGLPFSAAAAEQAGAAAPVAESVEALRGDFRAMVAEARDKVFPALVHIETITGHFWNGREQKFQSTGSGTIISPEGLVLTNAHVTENGREFTLTLADKTKVPATLVGEDAATDLALLQIDKSKLPDPDASLAYASLGDSDALQVGDLVMAMGSPYGLGRTVTLGIVSNTERVLFDGDAADFVDILSGGRTGQYTSWIQHDALINPGNSGGPLVNIRGEVIGVNTRGGSGMSFASPSNLARTIVDALREHGRVPRTDVGINFKTIERTGFDRGIFVDSVARDGPAAQAGIEPGDVVLSIDGEPLTVGFAEQIPPVMYDLAHREPGSTVTFEILRAGEPLTVDVVAEAMNPDFGDQVALREWGITVQEITPFMARVRRLGSHDGVMVTSTRSGGPAELAEPALAPGDIIHRAGDREIKTLQDLLDAYKDFENAEERPEHVVVEYDRRGKNYLSALDTEEIKLPDPPRELPKAWIGFASQPVVPELARRLGLADGEGFRVTRVYPGTRAADSGLQVGDIVVALNGERLLPRAMAQAGLLDRAIQRLRIGEDATLTVLRDGERTDVTVQTERSKIGPSEAKRVKNTDFGLTVRAITFFDRDDNRWTPDVRGVIVEDVESASWAAQAGVTPGMVIQRIGEHEITGTASFEEAMERVEAERPERIAFVVLRGYRTSYQFVEPDWTPEPVDADADDAPEDAEAQPLPAAAAG